MEKKLFSYIDLGVVEVPKTLCSIPFSYVLLALLVSCHFIPLP